MNVMEWMQVVAAIVGALGGLELIKFLATRASTKKKEEAAAEIASANADMAEVQVEDAQLDTLRKYIDFLQNRLFEEEKRYAEQTGLVRKLQAEVLSLTSKVVMLETERGLKLCERRNCAKREPQSGY